MTGKFNINRRKFISTGAALSFGIPFLGKAIPTATPSLALQPEVKPEWRNRQFS